MLYLSSYMKSQSDAKGPLTVQIDNNNATNSPVHHARVNNNRSGGELPPHLRYEQQQQQQQLLSPASTIATGTAGSVTAVDSDYDLPPEERQILSLSHSPSPAYQQPHLHQLTRLNQPNFQPSPVTRGPRSDLGGSSTTSKTGGTSFMNQATLANLTNSANSTATSNADPTSPRVLVPKMAFNHQHNHHLNNQQLYHSSYNNYNNNSHGRQQQQQLQQSNIASSSNNNNNNFQSPVSGKLYIGETSIYSVPKSGKVSSPKSNFALDSVKKASPPHQQPQQPQLVKLQPAVRQPHQPQQHQLHQQQQPQPAKGPLSTMTDREQKELDQLLRDMYQELATFPDYNTIRPTARSVSSHQQAIYNNNKPFARSISHSPSVTSRGKPTVLHYVPRTEEQVLRSTGTSDTVDSGAVYATLVAGSKGQAPTESSGCLPSSPSICDRESRGMSVRSVTLTPTPVRPLFATQHSLVTSTPKPVIVTDAPASSAHPTPGFKGTHVLPGAKIGDQEAANRVGVYASTLGKKNLSSHERQELDDLINVMMEEVRNFPDYSTTSRKSASGRSQQSTANRVGYLNGSISNLDEVGVEATPTQGVARTRAVFESVHSNQPYTHSNGNRSPSPGGRSRQSAISNRGEREKSSFSSGPTRTASISPVRAFNRGNSVLSGRSISTGRYPDRSSVGTGTTIVTQRAPSAASLLTASLNPPYGTAGGVLAQPSTEPLPPHLLTRPTQWCKDERSRPYHARADSRPFTYGVTSASPMIQRRRVHSESTAYVVENKPRPEPVVDYDEPPRTNGHSSSHSTYTAGNTRGLIRSPKPANNSNIYDDPSELEREMDAISEISYNSGDTVTAADVSSSPMSWLEKQQIKLKAKKDTSDTTYQEQKGKSKAMLNELTRTMSGSRVPAFDEMKQGHSDASSPVPPLRPPSPPKSRLIERLNLVNGSGNGSYLSGNNSSSTAPVSPVNSNFPRAPSPSKSKSVTLLTEDGEIVDTEGRPATPGRPLSSCQLPQQLQQQHVPSFITFSSGPTQSTPNRSNSPMRYASFLHNNSGQNNCPSPVKGEQPKSSTATEIKASPSSEPASPISKSVSSPIYASVNLIDKHRIAANNNTAQEENA